MFTIEIETNYTKVVALDDFGEHEDLELYIEDNGTVFIRQFCPELNEFQVCDIGYKQLLDIANSIGEKDGIYRTRVEPVK